MVQYSDRHFPLHVLLLSPILGQIWCLSSKLLVGEARICGCSTLALVHFIPINGFPGERIEGDFLSITGFFLGPASGLQQFTYEIPEPSRARGGPTSSIGTNCT